MTQSHSDTLNCCHILPNIKEISYVERKRLYPLCSFIDQNQSHSLYWHSHSEYNVVYIIEIPTRKHPQIHWNCQPQCKSIRIIHIRFYHNFSIENQLGFGLSQSISVCYMSLTFETLNCCCCCRRCRIHCHTLTVSENVHKYPKSIVLLHVILSSTIVLAELDNQIKLYPTQNTSRLRVVFQTFTAIMKSENEFLNKRTHYRHSHKIPCTLSFCLLSFVVHFSLLLVLVIVDWKRILPYLQRMKFVLY